jgi:outer membrane lipoprotein-sorting protein
MKNKIFLILFIMIFSTIFGLEANAYRFDFITVGDVVREVQATFGKLKSYQANFTITSTRDGRRTVQNGIVRYKAPDKLLVEFSSPAGQRIVSDGTTMWIHIPAMNVVAEQDLRKDSGSMATAATPSGLRRLFARYHYRFASKEQPEPQKSGDPLYTLQLRQKETRSGYRSMKLWVNKDYMIVRAVGETSTGKNVEIAFSNIRTNLDFQNAMFRFDNPQRVRTIKNPMVSAED